MPFDGIIGHALPIRIIRSMVQTGQVPHACIFSGIEGIGKRAVAMGFAKALNCLGPQRSSGCQCASCQAIERRMHPDLILLAPEKNVIRIDQVRLLQSELAFKPFEARYKVVIIDGADRMNVHAANCLLKTLEEPPEQTVLILIAPSTAGMLPTVLSRCHRIHFAPLAPADIGAYLCAQGVAPAQAEVLSIQAQGSIGRALMLRESAFMELRQKMADALAGAPRPDLDALLKLGQQAGAEPAGPLPVLEFLETWYRDLLLLKEGVGDELLQNYDLAGSLRAAAGHETRASALQSIRRIQWLQQHANLHADVSLGLEAVLINGVSGPDANRFSLFS